MSSYSFKANSESGYIELSKDYLNYEIKNRGISGLFKTYKIGTIGKSDLSYVKIRKLKDSHKSEFIIDYKEFLENGRFIPKQLRFRVDQKDYLSFKRIEEQLSS